MLRMRHMSFPIDHQAKAAWLENMHIAITEAQLPYGVGDYLYERLSLTANHMVNIEN